MAEATTVIDIVAQVTDDLQPVHLVRNRKRRKDTSAEDQQISGKEGDHGRSNHSH